MLHINEPYADEQEPTCHEVARQIGEQEKELASLSAINGCINTTTKKDYIIFFYNVLRMT